MKQYLDLMNRIVDEGKWVANIRTGTRCLTVIDAALEYDVANNQFPLVTTRKAYWKGAIAEFLGYIRGYTSAADFRAIRCKTWDANANDNASWLNNPNRLGVDDMGPVYGAVGNKWPVVTTENRNTVNERIIATGGTIDLLDKCYQNLLKGIDDRGEVWTFWNPGMFDGGCLRPCMHTHTFSLLDGVLHLTSYQRSYDGLLGGVFNAPQPFVFLALMAQITGHKPGKVFHKIVNAHIYEDQLEIYKTEQRHREPRPLPQLKINPNIKTLEDIRTWVTVDDFEVVGYDPHDPIAYPFTV